MQHFRDAAIDKKLEKLRTEVNVEAMAVRREDNGASRSSNPKLMQQYLHHNAMQGEQQSEVWRKLVSLPISFLALLDLHYWLVRKV